MEHYDIEPDLIIVAKSIAAGLPLSGVLGKAAIMDAPGDNAIGGTYAGNPVAQAAALAVLDVIEDEGLIGARSRSATRCAAGCTPGRALDAIGDVRGLGAMLAVEFVARPGGKEPAPISRRRSRPPRPSAGSCCSRPAVYSNCIHVLWPLCSRPELDEALTVWDEALESVLE